MAQEPGSGVRECPRLLTGRDEGIVQRLATLADLFERIDDGLIALDAEWRFVYVNRQAEHLLQAQRRDLLGKRIWDVMPDSIGSVFYEQFHRAMRDQEAVGFEEYYPPLDMWAAVSALPSSSGLIVYLSDITSLKRAEAALALSEGQLRAVIDNSPSPIFMKDLNGTLLRINDEFARLFGMTKDEIVGRNDYGLMPEEDAARIHANDLSVLASGEPAQFEEEMRAGEGKERHTYLSTKFPLKDVSGHVYGTAGIATDITERIRQERALAESEQRFRKVFEEGPLGVALLTPDQRFERVNDKYAALLGYTKEELAGLTIAEVTAEPHRGEGVELARRLVEGEIPNYHIEKQYVRKDGTTLWVSITGSLIRDDEGRPMFILALAEDISQRKLAETVLRDKDLTIRHAYTEVIAAVTGGKLVLMTPDELKEALGRPVSAEWRLTDYADLRGVRHAVADALRENGMPAERADGFLLAASEALTNAVKHAGEGRARLYRAPDALQLAVSDTGPGIDFENLPRATLVAGFSTSSTLGMGFTVMLEVCDRVLLTTQPGLTVVVLEMPLPGRPGS